MDLKIDYAFKQLFGNEKNKDILIVFLNAVLQRTNRKPIKDIVFLNIEAGGEYVDDKQSRLDVLVITENNEKINVEIQFTNKYDMIKRSIYYWAGTYRHTLQKSMTYSELQGVISINILNFNLFNQTEAFHTTYHLYEDTDKFELTDIMEFHFIEMSKLLKAWKDGKLDPWNDVLARWLLLLCMVDHRNDEVYNDIFKELEAIAMKDETLRDAFRGWEELSMTDEEFYAYEGRLKRILDEEAAQREAELRIERGIKKGIKEGLERGKEIGEELGRVIGMKQGLEQGKQQGITKVKIETAQRLLNEGMDTEFIQKITALSLEEIKKIQQSRS